jgi:integrase
VATVRELTADHVRQYQQRIAAGNYAPKSMRHRFAKVRTILAYAIRQQRSVEDCRRALDYCSLLEVKGTTVLDPRPIKVADFWAIHDAAQAEGNNTFATLMLTAANLAMYGSEVGALTWEEVDLKSGHVATRRRKTGMVRIGVLWPETLAGLQKIPRYRETIFNTRVRSYTQFSVVDAWARYRKALGMDDSVVFSQIRDASYSIALTVSLEEARLLAGHKMPGATDAYVLRNPQMVEKACAAIRSVFFAPGIRGKKSRSRIGCGKDGNTKAGR